MYVFELFTDLNEIRASPKGDVRRLEDGSQYWANNLEESF